MTHRRRYGEAMKGFFGFPAGKLHLTPLPSLFFSELLPAIDNLNELKVTLHILWRLNQQAGYLRYVRRSELLSDGILLKGLGAPGGRTPGSPLPNASPGVSPQECVQDGLERAAAQGTLLSVVARRDDTEETYYFLNSDKGRQAVEQWRRGELDLGGVPIAPEPRADVERPNIFVLYEQNIGLLQPMIAQELQEAEQTYPAEWIEDAFREAVLRNKRSWRYVQRILERWAAEGRGEPGRSDDRRRYVEGKYAEYFKQRPKEK